MRPAKQLATLLPGILLLSGTQLCTASGLNLAIKPGMFTQEASHAPGTPLKSGLGLAVKHELLNVNLDYDFQLKVDEQGLATGENTSQRLGASVRSSLLDRMFGVKSHIKTDSVLRAGGDVYNHKISPGFSRPLLNLATLDVGYQYLLNKASVEAVEKQQQSYSLGLKGSLGDGHLNWSGAYNSSDTFEDRALLTQSTETFRFRTDYRLAPGMKLLLTSAHKQETRFKGSGDNILAESRYGAGLSWTPSGRYALDLKVDRQQLSTTGEDNLLRSGTLSWFPRHDLALALNYGDQLIEGGRGVMFTTRLDLENL